MYDDSKEKGKQMRTGETLNKILASILLFSFTLDATPQGHSGDYAPSDGEIDLSELLRFIQFYNVGSYHVECGTEDNFAPGPGQDEPCLDPDLPRLARYVEEKSINRPVIVRDTGGLDLSIGNGVAFDELGRPDLGLEIFSGNLVPVSATQVDGVLDGNINYDFPPQTVQASFEYMDSYAEELEFKSQSLDAEVNYALFNGSVNYSAEQENYRRSTFHKGIIKIHYDYGWFEVEDLPLAEDLDPSVLENLENFWEERYGTHYVFAEHRFAELFVEVSVETSRAQSRDTVQAALNAKLSGIVSASVSAGLNNYHSSNSGGTTFTATLYTSGGPKPALEGIPQIAGSGFGELQSAVNEWVAGVSSFNTISREYYCRPLTDFVAPETIQGGALARQLNLSAWYVKLLEAFEVLERLDEIVDCSNGGAVFHPDYRYLLNTMFTSVSGDPLDANYYCGFRDTYSAAFDAMLELGAAIRAGEETFGPSSPYWTLPGIEFPQLYYRTNYLGLPISKTNYESTEKGSSFVWPIWVHGGNFEEPRYALEISRCGNPASHFITTDKIGYDDSVGATLFNANFIAGHELMEYIVDRNFGQYSFQLLDVNSVVIQQRGMTSVGTIPNDVDSQECIIE